MSSTCQIDKQIVMLKKIAKTDSVPYNEMLLINKMKQTVDTYQCSDKSHMHHAESKKNFFFFFFKEEFLFLKSLWQKISGHLGLEIGVGERLQVGLSHFCGWWNVLHLLWSHDYRIVCICQNLSSLHFKWVNFIVCKFHLNKTNF